MMAVDFTAICFHQLFEEFFKCRFLCNRSGIYTLIILTPASHIAHANGMGIVAVAVGTCPIVLTATFHRAVKAHYIMVAYISPTVT